MIDHVLHDWLTRFGALSKLTTLLISLIFLLLALLLLALDFGNACLLFCLFFLPLLLFFVKWVCLDTVRGIMGPNCALSSSFSTPIVISIGPDYIIWCWLRLLIWLLFFIIVRVGINSLLSLLKSKNDSYQ
jgi:hypothetical protein